LLILFFEKNVLRGRFRLKRINFHNTWILLLKKRRTELEEKKK